MDYCVGSFIKTCVEPTFACTGAPFVGDANQAKLPSQKKKRSSCMWQLFFWTKAKKKNLFGKPTIFMNLLKDIELDVEVFTMARAEFGLEVGELG
jgi:hypothetical protein